MEHIEWLQDGYAVLEPIRSASSFTSETHKYDRVSLAKDNTGRTVVFDDSDSINYTIDSKSYCIVAVPKILAILTEKE